MAEFSQYELPQLPPGEAVVSDSSSAQVATGNTQQAAKTQNATYGQDDFLAFMRRVESLEKYVDDLRTNAARLNSDVNFNNASVRDRLTASFGNIGGWDINAGVLSTPKIQIDSNNQRIRSANYIPGVSGFNIQGEFVEAENIVARGAIKGASFQYDTVSAVGGQLMVTNADVIDVDMSASDLATVTTKGITSFAVNDILLVRASTGTNIVEEWLIVTTKNGNTYTVTRDIKGDYATNSNPKWSAGTPIVKQGAYNPTSGNKYTAPTVVGSASSALTVFSSLANTTNNGKIKITVNGTVYDNVGISHTFTPAVKVNYPNVNNTSYTANCWGQTFTTGTNQVAITSMNIYLQNGVAVTVDIMPTSDPNSGTPLGSTTVTGNGAVTTVTFSSPVTVPKNTQISFRLVAASAYFTGYYAVGSGGMWTGVTSTSMVATSLGNNVTMYHVISGYDEYTYSDFATIATDLQTAIRAATSKLETVSYVTDHFVITGVAPDYSITVSAPSSGTNISGSGSTPYLALTTGTTTVGGYGDGGWLRLIGEGTNAPYYSVFKRLSGLYNDYQEAVRMGNLNGFLNYATNEYGIAIGDTNGYLTYDPTNGLRIAGNSSNTISLIAGEDLTVGQSLIIGDGTLGTTSGRVYKSNATSNDAKANNFIGIATETKTAGNSLLVAISGINQNLTGLTVGANYYLSNTAGTISTTAGTQSRKIGRAVSATSLLILNS